MKNVLIPGLLALTLLMSSACRKKLASADSDLIGTWNSSDATTTLQINANGKGSSHFDDGFTSKNIDGKVIVKNETITFKAFGIKESYKINKRPETRKGITEMELDGQAFQKRK